MALAYLREKERDCFHLNRGVFRVILEYQPDVIIFLSILHYQKKD